ncbi:hypothetical protein PR003_g33257 [Phytophthora rubi]|uniref:Clathrin/coatomer adaptor adaptin-like N-terminal domain-containing protein n=1 Tax=Phytophthora rubi TaxID=129364 RepID=A0A6A4AUV9_9STRA|nr:hypothetical protein PR003_g33257 [Phytophthora rubi]
MKFFEKVSDADTERSLSRKMAPPLVTLVSVEPEIQYVALRNINLIVQKRPPTRSRSSSASPTIRSTSRWTTSRSSSVSYPRGTSSRCCSSSRSPPPR